ncbi:MAG: hypothetical protein F9K13_01365 [Candidatus Methylomirabilis oxygeniifera]|uniref:Uncharacterized protein n=1 Tax=Methylomirabilis oxygeniifera TaxID=671143 RepID=D5MMJ6_METO1|nr:MAG: hypothetical protein F9K13_01365 [Candidatus Methylomirabilis oxyfera]CBE70118.1 protein of unknown function [Candidatus Methylomirabilis oxyfera]
MADPVNGGAIGAESGKRDMNDADKIPCNCCRELITKWAPVCYHCGRNQKPLMRYLTAAPVMISLTLVVLSWFQFSEARRQRQSADVALLRAEATERREEQIAKATNAALGRAEAAERCVTKIAKTAIPIFESLLESKGTFGTYSSKEMGKLLKPFKNAITECSESRTGPVETLLKN